MSHWLLDNLGDRRSDALKRASRSQILKEFYGTPFEEDSDLVRRTAETLELVVLDLIPECADGNEETLNLLKECAADAFRLLRALPLSGQPLEIGVQTLHMSALAVVGDMGSDAARLLRENSWPELPTNSSTWRERTWATIIDIWLRLIRKHGWEDRDRVLEQISELRRAQEEYERTYLESQPPPEAKASALELIGLYHLAKAAEVLALYITDGVVDGNYQIHQLLDTHFDRVFAAGSHVQLIRLEPLSRLLAACSAQMANNSIWTVTRAVNSRVTEFVRRLVDRGRGDRAIFDVLPPQRRALSEQGLLGSSRRAVVVCLPTSSGKTLISQFRILQALNQFEHERGWVAYLAPTKTLVNQVARQLRRDFGPLGIVVEQVSPALEIDLIEAQMLQEADRSNEFRVLVTTPEKLDLMLRQGWEDTIGRPLTLVVVDEAHNIQSPRRGLKLELLLSTINNECQNAQFLLLTPFIQNAREVARWLGGVNSDDVSLALEWQPNDRVIGVVQAERTEELSRRSFDYKISLETIHTTRRSLTTDELLSFPKSEEIAGTYSRVTNQSSLAAVAAQQLQQRGPIIVMHARPDWVWSLAEKFKIEENYTDSISEHIGIVRSFLELEFSPEFPLLELLRYRVGVHHAGLSDEVRMLMEWLFELGELRFLVATTTIAQGVNFPITGVVMASHQYPDDNRMSDMPPEDFWNIAGRAGRIGHGSLGVVALVADGNEKAQRLREFINRQSGDLNSALIQLAIEARDQLSDLGAIVYRNPEWSSFLQYLAHTYMQMGRPEGFAGRIEQVLRGTFGFGKLRTHDSELASQLLGGIQAYAEYLQQPGQPLGLVDSTGFSLQSIRTVLGEANSEGLRSTSWDSDTLFQSGDQMLRLMMGVLLKVPELRENLKAATGGSSPDGEKLSLIVKDWVNGVPVATIAANHFMGEEDDLTKAMTKCGQNLFGRLTQTASWGINALLAITASDLDDEERKPLNNLASKVFYGVNSDPAITLRLLGIPRTAATPLANSMATDLDRPLPHIRSRLQNMNESDWNGAVGGDHGAIYRRIWRILEGID